MDFYYYIYTYIKHFNKKKNIYTYTITNPLSSMYYFICNLKISKNNNSKMKNVK